MFSHLYTCNSEGKKGSNTSSSPPWWNIQVLQKRSSSHWWSALIPEYLEWQVITITITVVAKDDRLSYKFTSSYVRYRCFFSPLSITGSDNTLTKISWSLFAQSAEHTCCVKLIEIVADMQSLMSHTTAALESFHIRCRRMTKLLTLWTSA